MLSVALMVFTMGKMGEHLKYETMFEVLELEVLVEEKTNILLIYSKLIDCSDNFGEASNFRKVMF